ncbi:MAG: hypothetical protein Q9216_005271 [Gyalolechia sp. 2 TL-2023]
MNYLNLFQELIGKIPAAGESGNGDIKAELEDLHRKAIVEVRNGVAWKVRRFVFVGEKRGGEERGGGANGDGVNGDGANGVN